MTRILNILRKYCQEKRKLLKRTGNITVRNFPLIKVETYKEQKIVHYSVNFEKET